MHHVPHRKLGDLARLGARNVGDGHDLRGYVARRGALADLLPDLRHQCRVQHRAGLEPHEQHHAHVTLPVLPDGQRLDHFRHLLDLRIDFRRADPHPARVQRGIGAAVNDHAAMRGDLREVAMAPDAGKAREIGVVILRSVRVVPEHHRHGGEWPHADELALLRPHRPAMLVIDIHGNSQHRSLDLAAPDGRQRIAAHEAAADVGAAGNRGELQV